MKMKTQKVLCTGATGQDASFLMELLLEKGYEVYGLKRRTATDGYENIKHLLNDINIIEGDICDQSSLNYIIKEIQPDEVYHLAAMSHVGSSFKQPLLTADVTGLGTLRLLEAIREYSPKSKFYNAATSELFGGTDDETLLNENSVMCPKSPYAVAKLFGYHTTINYRKYGIFASNGILFNHSSIRRGYEFATRKITSSAAKIKLGLQKELVMGNIESKRDEGCAKDYAEAMYLILQHNSPDNFVISTGETHSIREMIEVVFNHIGLNYRDYLKIDPKLYRPNEVNVLCGDPSKAKKILGWKPKYSWRDLLIEMVEYDLKLLKK